MRILLYGHYRIAYITFKLTCATKGLDAISAAAVLGAKLSSLFGYIAYYLCT